jgi:hypothetical protein
VFAFIDELLSVIPEAQFHRRKVYNIGEVVTFAKNEAYTDVLFVNEYRKKPRTSAAPCYVRGCLCVPTCLCVCAAVRVSGFRSLTHLHTPSVCGWADALGPWCREPHDSALAGRPHVAL